VEHLNEIFNDIFKNLAETKNIPPDAIAKLSEYAGMIHEENQKFNLTGFKSLEEIARSLIGESIIPLININVPRGTFVDLGSGAGVPGIPLGIVYPQWRGVLIDSNSKKTTFISNVIKALQLSNLSVVNGRAEDLAISEFRQLESPQMLNFIVCRAFAEPYVSLEAGVPLLCLGGMMYIFSKFTVDELDVGIVDHAVKLGATGIKKCDMPNYGFPEIGLLFIKTQNTPSEFPRRFSVIKKCSLPFRKQV
jgi:16S rRNA (guanine527-N7)-methyltransferase